MHGVWRVWLEFAFCVLLIGYGGIKLSRYGDVIAEKTGLGGTWVGIVLLATVTSLPELITGISSVTVAGVPNIAVGDALGSCVFNLLILVILDLLVGGESVYTRVKQGHILSAGFGILLIGFVGFTSLTADKLGHLGIGHVGIYTPIIILFYGLAMRTVFRYERQEQERYVEEAVEHYPEISLRKALLRYALAALVVIGAGAWLPFIGILLTEVMGWHQTFVGTLFVAFATSAPELVSTIAAARIGAFDMAVANLLGSNLFDILIIAVDDVFFLEAPILSRVSKIHGITVKEHRKRSGSVAMCDDPCVAVGPYVLSESAAIAQVETKHKATDTASSHLWEPWRGAERSGVPAVADAGRTRAAEGKACRQFFAPFGDLDVPKGFAKNGDTIAFRR